MKTQFPSLPLSATKMQQPHKPITQRIILPWNSKISRAKIRLWGVQSPQPDYLEPKWNRYRDLLEEGLLHWRFKKNERIEPSGYLCLWCWAKSRLHKSVMYLPLFLLKLLNDKSISTSHLLKKCWSFLYLFPELDPEVVKDARLISLCLPAAEKTAGLQPTQRTNSTAYYSR